MILSDLSHVLISEYVLTWQMGKVPLVYKHSFIPLSVKRIIGQPLEGKQKRSQENLDPPIIVCLSARKVDGVVVYVQKYVC